MVPASKLELCSLHCVERLRGRAAAFRRSTVLQKVSGQLVMGCVQRWVLDSTGQKAGPRPAETQWDGLGKGNRYQGCCNSPAISHKGRRVAKGPNFDYGNAAVAITWAEDLSCFIQHHRNFADLNLREYARKKKIQHHCNFERSLNEQS